MLTQYRLYFDHMGVENFRAEWAYRLYAALLKQCPAEFGALVHTDQITPVSQFLTWQGRRVIWRVSLLGEACESALCPVLENARNFSVSGVPEPLLVSGREKCEIQDVDRLFENGAQRKGRHQLTFCTPTAFKSRGRYQTMPSQHLIVQSLIRKWNSCILECPIEDEDGQGAEALADGLKMTDFKIHSCNYLLKGSNIPGFVGSMTVENRLHGFHRELADALLVFAGYAGVGIKTTLGMGGVIEK